MITLDYNAAKISNIFQNCQFKYCTPQGAKNIKIALRKMQF